MKHLESNLQQSCVRWFRYQYSDYQNLLIAIPNGGYRNRTEAAILIGEGVVRGCPDLFLAVPKKGFAGLWIEMKAPKGRLTEYQQGMLIALENVGYMTHVCYSFDEFEKVVTNYLK